MAPKEKTELDSVNVIKNSTASTKAHFVKIVKNFDGWEKMSKEEIASQLFEFLLENFSESSILRQHSYLLSSLKTFAHIEQLSIEFKDEEIEFYATREDDKEPIVVSIPRTAVASNTPTKNAFRDDFYHVGKYPIGKVGKNGSVVKVADRDFNILFVSHILRFYIEAKRAIEKVVIKNSELSNEEIIFLDLNYHLDVNEIVLED